jgi:hypothetical protein
MALQDITAPIERLEESRDATEAYARRFAEDAERARVQLDAAIATGDELAIQVAMQRYEGAVWLRDGASAGAAEIDERIARERAVLRASVAHSMEGIRAAGTLLGAARATWRARARCARRALHRHRHARVRRSRRVRSTAARATADPEGEGPRGRAGRADHYYPIASSGGALC